jgi:hypothetical protein
MNQSRLPGAVDRTQRNTYQESQNNQPIPTLTPLKEAKVFQDSLGTSSHGWSVSKLLSPLCPPCPPCQYFAWFDYNASMSDALPMSESRCDVLVIGGGPAGSTIAALLAERGRDVVLVETHRQRTMNEIERNETAQNALHWIIACPGEVKCPPKTTQFNLSITFPRESLGSPSNGSESLPGCRRGTGVLLR